MDLNSQTTTAESSPASDAGGGSYDVDQILSNIESTGSAEGNGSATGGAAPDSAPPTQAAPAQAPVQTGEFEFTWNGRQIKVPPGDARLKQWAQQGYDYSQRIQAFNQERSQFEATQKEIAALKEKYAPVEEFYSKNPDKWERVVQDFQTNQNGIDPNHPIVQKISALESQVNQAAKFITESQSRELKSKHEQEDKAFIDQTKSIQEKYQNLDWNTVDAEGKTMELRVLEYARQNGINNFQTAFRDLYHDDLVKLAADQAKESVTKERQKAAKQGIIGQSPTPTRGVTNQNIKSQSYDDLMREGAAEYGVAL